jgi:hypothetical protein
MKMVLLARTVAVLSGISFLAVLIWLIWRKWSLAIIPGVILSVFSLWICSVIGMLIGEHFFNFLTRNKK